jgi:RecA-family ATPase
MRFLGQWDHQFSPMYVVVRIPQTVPSVPDTVRLRLLAFGADLDRVFNLEGIQDRHGDDVLRFPQHAQALCDIPAQTQAKLLVMDPFVAFLDKGVATYNHQSGRAVLRLLMGIVTEHQCAVLLVRHLNKEEGQRSLYRGGGSIGFVAGVRCAWLRSHFQTGTRLLNLRSRVPVWK